VNEKGEGGKSDPSIRILFLGQCLSYGYQGVGKSSTFSHLAALMLRARFPGVRFRFDLKYFHHPRGLKALLRHRLLFKRPDIAVISLPAMFAAANRRVSAIYEIAPELVDTARSFAQRIEETIRRTPSGGFETLLDKTSTVQPPVALDEYERLIEEAVTRYLQNKCRLIMIGPGRFNEDTIENYAIHSPELWSSVNAMVLRLGERHGLPVVNAQQALEGHGGEVFIRGNHRFSAYGHEIVAREVERVIASQILVLTSGGDGRNCIGDHGIEEA
jgi:hypothetical protein